VHESVNNYKTKGKQMAAKGYNFNTNPVTVVTPEAKTLFMCLAEVNEYTGKFGGKLVFTPEQLNQEVSFKENGGAKGRKAFGAIVSELLDNAYNEYTTDTGKKATKVSKIQDGTNADGDADGTSVISTANQNQPDILDSSKKVIKDYDVLVGNGSTVVAQLYLKPYVMQGKVGVTAYLNKVVLKDIIEFGGSDDLFDDDTFESDDDTLSDDF